MDFWRWLTVGGPWLWLTLLLLVPGLVCWLLAVVYARRDPSRPRLLVLALTLALLGFAFAAFGAAGYARHLALAHGFIVEHRVGDAAGLVAVAKREGRAALVPGLVAAAFFLGSGVWLGIRGRRLER